MPSKPVLQARFAAVRRRPYVDQPVPTPAGQQSVASALVAEAKAHNTPGMPFKSIHHGRAAGDGVPQRDLLTASRRDHPPIGMIRHARNLQRHTAHSHQREQNCHTVARILTRSKRSRVETSAMLALMAEAAQIEAIRASYM
jgi:hypothetical protein